MPNVTNKPGGRISGFLNDTFEATDPLEISDPVIIVGDRQVGVPDGTKTIVGYVAVSSKKRVLGNYPVVNDPGTVTVEMRGFAVRKVLVGAAPVAAGIDVGHSAASPRGVVAMGAGVTKSGVTLHSASAGAYVDILVQ